MHGAERSVFALTDSPDPFRGNTFVVSVALSELGTHNFFPVRDSNCLDKLKEAYGKGKMPILVIDWSLNRTGTPHLVHQMKSNGFKDAPLIVVMNNQAPTNEKDYCYGAGAELVVVGPTDFVELVDQVSKTIKKVDRRKHLKDLIATLTAQREKLPTAA